MKNRNSKSTTGRVRLPDAACSAAAIIKRQIGRLRTHALPKFPEPTATQCEIIANDLEKALRIIQPPNVQRSHGPAQTSTASEVWTLPEDTQTHAAGPLAAAPCSAARRIVDAYRALCADCYGKWPTEYQRGVLQGMDAVLALLPNSKLRHADENQPKTP